MFAPVILSAAVLALSDNEARAHSAGGVWHSFSYPLHGAAHGGSLTAINHFLSVHMTDVNAKDDQGDTPLHYAASNGQVSAIATLIAAGANMNAKDGYRGRTPLHRGIYRGHVSVVSALLAAGAAVNATNQYGATPLHEAAGAIGALNNPCSPVIVSVLMAAGADLQSGNNYTPLNYALNLRPSGNVGVKVTYPNCPDIALALINAGADTSRANSPLGLLANNASGDTEKVNSIPHALTVAQALIQRGDDVNDGYGKDRTPLYSALYRAAVSLSSRSSPHGWFDLADLLIENGGHYGTACARGKVTNPRPATVTLFSELGILRRGGRDACICPAETHTETNLGNCEIVAVCDSPAVLNEAANRCDCLSPNVGANRAHAPGECSAPSEESCGKLTPPQFYDSTAGECVGFKGCLSGANLNRDENICECAGVAVLDETETGCLCESPNVGTGDDCAEPSEESCGGLTPPQFYDEAEGECAGFKGCLSNATLNRDDNVCECAEGAALDGTGLGCEFTLGSCVAVNLHYNGANCEPLANCAGAAMRNESTNQCECLAPNLGTPADCQAPSAESCGGLTPPKFYDSTTGECAEFKSCLSGATLNRGENTCECAPPSVLDGTGLGCEFTLESCAAANLHYNGANCEPLADCAAPTTRNQSTNQCECHSPNLGTVGDCQAPSAENCAEFYNPPRFYDASAGECAGRLYPCHDSAIRKADNSGCECPPGTFAHGDPSGGSHSHIPDTAICHADHAPIFHDLNGWLDSIQADNPTLILHFISDHDESPNQLAHAIQHSAHRAITILINRGANLNLADSDGDTPLHLAARRSDTPENAALVSFLLDKGANPNIRNNAGWRPLDLAYHGGNSGTWQARRKIMSALINGGANWSDECSGGAIPNENYRGEAQVAIYPQCRCPAHMSQRDSGGACECPAHSHSQVNGRCLPQGSAEVDAEIAKMQVELARLRAALVSLNARLSLSAEMPREMVEDIAEQARETAAEIDWRRANFVALGRTAEAGEAPPPVALSDTAAECRMRGGEVRIDSGSGTRICLGLDQSGTFCLVDSGDAFPCRGLFKHVRRCNDVYHRPALNAFICGGRCGADETARGRGCE